MIKTEYTEEQKLSARENLAGVVDYFQVAINSADNCKKVEINIAELDSDGAGRIILQICDAQDFVDSLYVLLDLQKPNPEKIKKLTLKAKALSFLSAFGLN